MPLDHNDHTADEQAKATKVIAAAAPKLGNCVASNSIRPSIVPNAAEIAATGMAQFASDSDIMFPACGSGAKQLRSSSRPYLPLVQLLRRILRTLPRQSLDLLAR